MAALATYYYSSASFSTAVALYTDAALSIFAPDGWYSDESVFRQQASGILYAEGTCPSCGTPAPVPTPITYDYRIYDECAGSGTQVFRVPSGGSWPATVLYSSVCYGNPQVTGSTSTVNVSGLPSYANCSACGTPPTTNQRQHLALAQCQCQCQYQHQLQFRQLLMIITNILSVEGQQLRYLEECLDTYSLLS